MSNTQPIESTVADESPADKRKRQNREAAARSRAKKATAAAAAAVAVAVEQEPVDPNLDPENDPAEVAAIEAGILAALDEAVEIVHGDDEDITPSPTDYRQDNEIGKVIQMADHDPSLRERTRAFLHPAEKSEPTPRTARPAPVSDVAVNEESVNLYRQAMNLKKNTKRGKGVKVTDAELVERAEAVMASRPGAFCLHEQEIAYWVDGLALTDDRWKAAWATAGGTFEKAPRLRKA